MNLLVIGNDAYEILDGFECVQLYRTMHPKMRQKYANKDPMYYDFDEDFGESFF